MRSAYLAISILKQSKIPIEQLKIFLSYVNQKALKEYLTISNIQNGKNKLCTSDLIDLIINGNSKNNAKKNNNELPIDEVNKILNANEFILNLMTFFKLHSYFNRFSMYLHFLTDICFMVYSYS